MKESEYPLTIEILVDYPCGAMLEKGQICKAARGDDGDFLVLDPPAPAAPWMIDTEHAKVIS